MHCLVYVASNEEKRGRGKPQEVTAEHFLEATVSSRDVDYSAPTLFLLLVHHNHHHHHHQQHYILFSEKLGMICVSNVPGYNPEASSCEGDMMVAFIPLGGFRDNFRLVRDRFLQ